MLLDAPLAIIDAMFQCIKAICTKPGGDVIEITAILRSFETRAQELFKLICFILSACLISARAFVQQNSAQLAF